MAATPLEQVVELAVAVNVTGDETVLPFAGEVITTPFCVLPPGTVKFTVEDKAPPQLSHAFTVGP
jgi:hypothetical protein